MCLSERVTASMDPQDYPIRHFESMVRLAAVLKTLPAQILEHRYDYDSFGTSSTIVRYKGIPLRIVVSPRDGSVQLQRSATRKHPYSWQDCWRHPTVPGEDPFGESLLTAITDSVQA